MKTYTAATDPMHVDYYNLGGASKGRVQHGLLKWVNEEACFCMASPGQPRPIDFGYARGIGHTFSQWRMKE